MNTPQIFNFEHNEVRTILVNDEPYFVGKDVADVLGYSNPQKLFEIMWTWRIRHRTIRSPSMEQQLF